jgi:bile acid-coenzyme A ligase
MTRRSISRAFTALAEAEPDRLAVRDAEASMTRAELDARSNALARVYLDAGVRTDDFVTLQGGNTIDFVVACVAIWKAGATPQPLSNRLAPDEQRAIVALAEPSLVVGAPPELAFGRPALPLAPDLAGVDTGLLPDAAARSWKAPTSSGSTGRPKIVVAAAPALLDEDARVAAFVPRAARQLTTGPLHHAAPFIYAMRGLMTGHELVLRPRFEPADWLATVERERITWGMVVPTMMSRLLRLPSDLRAAADVSSLESILHLGAPCPEHVKRAFLDWLGPTRVVEVYAGTESRGLTSIRGDEWLEHPGSVGRPVGGSRMRIVDDAGGPLPTGTIGTIEMTRAGGATYRYRGAPTPPEDDWDTLGDSGSLDADGYLYVADRRDDLIVTGGVNVWPAEVEAVLEQHPAVRSCGVTGVPDDDLGRRVHAVVDLAGDAVSTEELAAWLRGRLDPEKRPRSWRVVAEPVRDDAGKVRRALLGDA